ncbi:uncharacterized protein LOC143275431 isoform X2 [Babylonia areolata]
MSSQNGSTTLIFISSHGSSRSRKVPKGTITTEIPSDVTTNVSYLSTTTHVTAAGDGGEGMSGGAVAAVVVVIALGISIMAMLIYLKVTHKLYRLVPCGLKVSAKRRSSTSSSRRPLDVDDPEDEGRREDDLPVTREATMFTIDDFEPVHNDEYDTRRGNSEEYFYDEVFGQSEFEDEATNASMRHLYLVDEQDEDDEFDVEAIVSNIVTSVGIRSNRRNTSTATPETTTPAVTSTTDTKT